MRIISGKNKGKKLLSPSGDNVRPTADRIKETIFNIVASKTMLQNAVVLDLFCGSGALGIECISRGAEEVIFVDASRESCKLTFKNLQLISNNSIVHNVEYTFALKKLASQNKQFDIIFLDPPYNTNCLNIALEKIFLSNLLKKNGVIVAEYGKEYKLTQLNDCCIDTRDCGNTCISIITNKESGSV